MDMNELSTGAEFMSVTSSLSIMFSLASYQGPHHRKKDLLYVSFRMFFLGYADIITYSTNLLQCAVMCTECDFVCTEYPDDRLNLPELCGAQQSMLCWVLYPTMQCINILSVMKTRYDVS